MTLAVLALPNGPFRLQCHLKSLLLPLSIPTAKAFSSSLAFNGEETSKMKALNDIPNSSASPDASIFESWSNEYNSVGLPKAVLARRRTMSVASTPANQGHHAIPHPSDSPDASIFESWSDEYNSVRLPYTLVAGRALANQGHRSSGVLMQLSKSRKFAEAEQVRQELVEMNVPIRPSLSYYIAGLNILKLQPWPPNRTEMFANWLSLLPSMANDRKPPSFGPLQSAIFSQSGRLDLETVAQFGIIMSSKGYIRRMGTFVVSCLTRHAHPDFSSRILDEMIAANDDFYRSELGATLNASTRKDDTTKRLWSVAVRTHCIAGRSEVALKMAKRANEHGFKLTKYSYEFLLGKLEADGLNELVAELRDLSCCESLDAARSRLVDDGFRFTSIPPISPKQSQVINRDIALANLKRSSRSGLPAYAVDIVPYFDIYKTDLRGDAEANELRAGASRISHSATSTVLLAELLHHLRRGQFRHVLLVFDKYFHSVGVPSEEVERQLWKRKPYPSHWQLNHEYLTSHIKETTFNLPSKLWPSRYHTALVWSALVHLCETEEELFPLYDLLLRQSAELQKSTAGHHHHTSHVGSSSFAPVLAPRDRFEPAHFRSFLVAFTLLRGDVKFGLRVLDDMQERGIAPDAHFLGTAAAIQARHGDPEVALRMLDATRGLVERAIEEEEAKAGELELEAGVGMGRKNLNRKQQLLVSYTSVLRGFVDSRQLARARQVANLLHTHLGYVEGTGAGGVDGDSGGNGNVRTDAALRYLRRLEAEGPDSIPEPLAKAEEDLLRHHYPFLKKPDSEVINTLSRFTRNLLYD